DVTQDAYATGFHIDVNLDRVTAHAMGERARQEGLQALEPRLEFSRHGVPGHAGDGFGNFAEREAAARSTDDLDATIPQVKVLDTRLHEMCGNPEHFLAHGERGKVHGGSGSDGLSAGEAALSVRNDGGVARDHGDAISGNGELLGADLGECCLDPLPHWHGAGINRDTARTADTYNAGLERSTPRPLHAIADADTEMAAVFARATLPFGKSGIIDCLERHGEAARKIAAVEGNRRAGARLERRDIWDLVRRHEIAPPHFGPIEVQLACNTVEYALHGKLRFGIAGAANRHGRDLVGLDHQHPQIESGQDIGPRYAGGGVVRQVKTLRRISALVVGELAAQTEDASFTVECDFEVPVLVALLHRRQKVLTPVFNPFDRALQTQSGG